MNEKKPVVVFHNDIDGQASGAIIQRYLNNWGKYPTMIQMNYDDVFPWDLIDSETEVWMTDFSLQPWSEMERLKETCKNFRWIDHHKTAIESYNEWAERTRSRMNGLRRDGTAACRLCWEYCYSLISEPTAIYLAGVYDVWAWQDVPGAIEFQYGTKFYETNPAEEEGKSFWKEQIQHPKSAHTKVVQEGKLLMRYKERSNANFIKSHSFETTLDELSVIAVNRKGNSQQFNAVWDPKKHDAMLTFCWAKGIWTVSLYSDRKDVDVSLVAKKYGGGGHRSAAGFQVKELPFKLR